MSQKFVQTPVISLYLPLSSSGVSAVVTPYPADLDGNKLTMSDFGDTPTFTTDPKVSGYEEINSFTGIVDNGNNTATLTGLTRNLLSKSPYTASPNGGKSHGSGAIVVFSDNPQLYARLVSAEGDQTIAGIKTFSSSPIVPTPTTSTQAANKSYVDGVAIAGAPKASTTVYGISKTSVAPVSAVDPIAVGDNDPRVPTQNENDALVGTSGTAPSASNKFVDSADTATTFTTNKIVRALASGKIDNSFIDLKFGGTGADGALNISSGTTTINLAGATTVVKNYTSISITGTANLVFSNPSANGTIVILKSQGTVTITTSANPAIDMRSIGASENNNGIGLVTRTITGGSGNTARAPGINNTPSVEGKFLNLYTGAGGSHAGGSLGQGSGEAGAGALYIECGGDLNITSNINLAGIAGTDGSGSTGSNISVTGGTGGSSMTDGGNGTSASQTGPGGGGGGGGGGVLIILYNGTLVASSGTYTVSGGAGGYGGGASGGVGGTGYSIVAKNNYFK